MYPWRVFTESGTFLNVNFFHFRIVFIVIYLRAFSPGFLNLVFFRIYGDT